MKPIRALVNLSNRVLPATLRSAPARAQHFRGYDAEAGLCPKMRRRPLNLINGSTTHWKGTPHQDGLRLNRSPIVL